MQIAIFETEPRYQAGVRNGFRYVALDELLAQSDVEALHVPVLLQNARLLDVRALIEALRDGSPAAAGLDVLPDEPLIREEAELISSIYDRRRDVRDLIADHVLLKMPNVAVTPHRAFNTREATGRISQTTVANIEFSAASRQTW